MRISHFAVPLVSLTLFCGQGYCESHTESHSEQVESEQENLHYVRYGRKMQHNRGHDEYYCGEKISCSNYRRGTRMSYEDRQMLRQQVNDTSRSLDAKK